MKRLIQFPQGVTVSRSIDGSILQKVQKQNSLGVPDNCEEYFTCRKSCFEFFRAGNDGFFHSIHLSVLRFGSELVDPRFSPPHNPKEKIIAILMVTHELFQVVPCMLGSVVRGPIELMLSCIQEYR
ncbi:hypothetical protein TNCV_3103631 [Trichonephila clavipes]|nr:hypothetical protein TNCV_3103631 [Trichonephila clavipes]